MKRTALQAKRDLARFASPAKAKTAAKFFKTGKGQYGEGDKFIGVIVPDTRQVAKKFLELPPKEITLLLRSKIHEERLLATLILTERAKKADTVELFKIFRFYLENLSGINNWDLVDASAPYIVGRFLESRPRETLYALVQQKNMWERRVAIVSTLHLIRQNDLKDVFALALLLLNDEEDLMHKATGWMLREAGKKNPKMLLRFLKKHHSKMPRTMLRYAIEKFPPLKRKQMLAGKF